MAHTNIPLGLCPVCTNQIFVGMKFCSECSMPIDSNTSLPPRSILAYFSPRGIKGLYRVSLHLGLLPTERADVYINRKRGNDYPRSRQEAVEVVQKAITMNDSPLPKALKAQTDRIEMYLIDEFIVGDKITVQIHDMHTVPFQTVVYTATKQGLTAKPKPGAIHHGSEGIISFHNYHFA